MNTHNEYRLAEIFQTGMLLHPDRERLLPV